MSVIGKLLLFLLLMPPTVEDLTPLERSRADFSQAITREKKVEVRWELSRGELPQDGELQLTFIIKNALNPGEIVPPELKKRFPEFAQRVQLVEPAVRQDSATEVRFHYTLRPLGPPGKVVLPAVKFVYYRQDFPEELRFQTAYPPSAEFTILPPSTALPIPLEAPAHFWKLREVKPSLGRSAIAWSWLPLLLPLVLVPGLLLLWRRLFPDAVRRAMLRRNRAARQAFQELRLANTAQATRLAVLGYLQARFGLNTASQTPSEILDKLKHHSPERLAELNAFLLQCDEVRFSPISDGGLTLKKQAEIVVSNWEASQLQPRTPLPMLLGVLALLLVSATPAEHFEQGVQLRGHAVQAKEQFREAAKLWSGDATSPGQFSNAARAYFLAGDLPRALKMAIAGHRQFPWDYELQEDLIALRDEVAYPITVPMIRPKLSSALATRFTPTDAWMISGFVAMLLVVALFRWLNHRDIWGRLLMIYTTLAVLMFIGLLVQLHNYNVPEVLVLNQPAMLFSGNSMSYDAKLTTPLPRGAEVEVLHVRGGWCLVELPNGIRGWLKQTWVV